MTASIRAVMRAAQTVTKLTRATDIPGRPDRTSRLALALDLAADSGPGPSSGGEGGRSPGTHADPTTSSLGLDTSTGDEASDTGWSLRSPVAPLIRLHEAMGAFVKAAEELRAATEAAASDPAWDFDARRAAREITSGELPATEDPSLCEVLARVGVRRPAGERPTDVGGRLDERMRLSADVESFVVTHGRLPHLDELENVRDTGRWPTAYDHEVDRLKRQASRAPLNMARAAWGAVALEGARMLLDDDDDGDGPDHAA